MIWLIAVIAFVLVVALGVFGGVGGISVVLGAAAIGGLVLFVHLLRGRLREP